jgi:hypothetical protein
VGKLNVRLDTRDQRTVLPVEAALAALISSEVLAVRPGIVVVNSIRPTPAPRLPPA